MRLLMFTYQTWGHRTTVFARRGFAEIAHATGLHRLPVLLVHHEEAGMETEQGVLGRLDAMPVGGRRRT